VHILIVGAGLAPARAVRELANTIERAAILCAGDEIQPEHLIFPGQLLVRDQSWVAELLQCSDNLKDGRLYRADYYRTIKAVRYASFGVVLYWAVDSGRDTIRNIEGPTPLRDPSSGGLGAKREA
jgi:hypothetical protein